MSKKLDLFQLGESYDDIKNYLIDLIIQWGTEIEEAAPVFDIEGEYLEKVARDLAHHQSFYAHRAAEAKALVKWLELERARLEARHIKNYHSAPRALGVKEQSMYIAGEKDIIAMNQLIVEVSLKRDQFEEIVEAIKQLGWMIGHITKLRVAELTEILL